MIYIVVFLLSCFLSNSANKRYGNRKFGFCFYSILAIACPVLLAGLRDYSIGTDTLAYVNIFHAACESNSLVGFFLTYPSVEKGYMFISYLVSRISSNPSVMLSVNHALIIVPLYIAFFRMRDNLNPVLSLFIFFFFFYNESLNLTRQYISMSFIILAATYIIDNRVKPYIVLSIIAFLFHSTALLGLLWLVFLLTATRFPFKGHIIVYSLMIFALAYAMLNLEDLGLLSSLGDDMSEKFGQYITGGASTMSLSNSTFIVYLYTLLIVLLCTLGTQLNDKALDAFVVMALLALSTVFLSTIARALYRLSLIFSMFATLSIPYIWHKYIKTCSTKQYNLLRMLVYGFFALAVVYWVFAFVIVGSNGTYPYLMN